MLYRISYIVYVYDSFDTVERCVESLVYGDEKNYEIILAEDGSKDNSHTVCKRIEEQWGNITCILNHEHIGRVRTLNKALHSAQGKYIVFVESRDWTGRRYGKLLCQKADDHPNTLIISGYRTTPGLFGYEKNILFHKYIDEISDQYFDLMDQNLLSPLWNKIFCAEILKKNDIRFKEEEKNNCDFCFIVDYIKAAQCRQFIRLNIPVYTHVIEQNATFDSRLDSEDFMREVRTCQSLAEFLYQDVKKVERNYRDIADKCRRKYIHRMMYSRVWTIPDKIRNLQLICKGEVVFGYYLAAWKDLLIGFIEYQYQQYRTRREKKRKNKQQKRNAYIIRAVRGRLTNTNVSILSQNCIGGVFYHDMGLEFQSPTINLFFNAGDFLKLVSDIRHYMKEELRMYWGMDYPIGELGDIRIHFMHYHTCREATEAWERRKKRICYDRIFVILTDRDGFTEEEYQKWKALECPKVLFTVHSEYKKEKDVVFYSEYKKNSSVPDLIFARKFYKDGILLSNINTMKAMKKSN